MRNERVLILSFLLMLQSMLCANGRRGHKKVYPTFLFKTDKVIKQKFKFKSKYKLKSSRTFLTGIKPSGNIHLGNYIGCLNPIINVEATKIKNMCEKSKTANLVNINKIIIIADLHSLTNINNIFTLKQNVIHSVNIILSLIIDMYVKKKKYIDVLINNVKLEDLLKLFKINKFLSDEKLNNLEPSTKESHKMYSFLNCQSRNDKSNVPNDLRILLSDEMDNLSNVQSTQVNKKMKEKKHEAQQMNSKQYIKQRHSFYIFKQSDIAQHMSLYYLINSFTSINLLNTHIHIRNVTKDKSVALLSYPNLMLADILLYEPDYLIVGEDQKKNIEIIKKISKKINSYFPDIIKLPKIYSSKFNIQIMNLDGHKKMSKDNDTSLNEKKLHNIIYLFYEKHIIEKKIKKAKTDNYNNLIYAQPGRREINNLMNIFFFFYYYKMKSIHTPLNQQTHITPHQEHIDELFLHKHEQVIHKYHPPFSTTLENVNNSNNNNTSLYSNSKQNDNIILQMSAKKINEGKLYLTRNNINSNINPQIGNHILSFYNNNYSVFKYELSNLIYDHFLLSKYIHSLLQMNNNLVNQVLKDGKKCISTMAKKNFQIFKNRLNI
ncbi:tryptophan--tRNA ligase [Plasmodium gonderi]|uniref:Tryptophan--tRNA ligase n=1 Tax=Plasmodium gonderi TaxID=77519 RepID=A0A1Y1JN34_PLAGO|nr:tryptophan--tRNA ligase [Plasmodium gonderi]GAW83881.1 tryptophan--tRNA ligase [Plasmodium gonderi]